MIEFEDRGAVTILRMVRGKGNALNLEFVAALINALDEIERGPARAAVITGEGNVFGAGVDLPALVAGGPVYVREFIPLIQRSFERLATYPKPLVAAVNGHAIAGGAIIMLACDQRLLARGTARLGLTEVLVGVTYPAWAMEIARFATPPEHFPTLILNGRLWQVEESLARGLVDELVEHEWLLERACEVAEDMGEIAPDAFAATKMAIRRPMIEAARRQSELTDAAVIEHWCSPQVLERINAFATRTIKRPQS
jgi:enoyl-CoA hydratase